MAEQKKGAAPAEGRDEAASGSVDRPIPPDEAQPGDRSEQGANLGGPVDVFPGARRGAVDHGTPGTPATQNRTGPGDRKG